MISGDDDYDDDNDDDRDQSEICAADQSDHIHQEHPRGRQVLRDVRLQGEDKSEDDGDNNGDDDGDNYSDDDGDNNDFQAYPENVAYKWFFNGVELKGEENETLIIEVCCTPFGQKC